MLYLIIIFLGAFLLFQVQPLIAKLMLPFFGGGASIWTACLLFFQAFLLLGYCYSHLLTKLNSTTKQVVIHALLLLISLYFLPINLAEIEFTNETSSPMKNILMLLIMSVGLPYFMLATTAPLVQRWLSYVDVHKLPYKLYSLSNIGSLFALLSYPLLIEPLPLCIYLLSFILSFHSPHWYVRWYWFVLFVIASFVGILLFFIGSQFDIITQIVLYSFVLLSACMICHGELARLKPEVERLTLFYLYISIGGFLGSFFVVYVAQNMFSQFYEFPLAIFLVYILLVASILLKKNGVIKLISQN